MVKINRSFQYVYPIDKKIDGSYAEWDPRILKIHGIASITSQGRHPIFAGWYRVQLASGAIVVDITFTSIIDNKTGEDLLPELQKPEYYEILHALTELCRRFNMSKFLS